VEEVGRILSSILKRQVQRRDPPVVEILAPFWSRVAGKALAECCYPVDFQAGTLTLATDCATWSAQLRQMSQEIRAEINSFLGEPVVRRLRIRQVRRLDAAAMAVEVTRTARQPGREADTAGDPGSPLARTVARSYRREIIRRRKKEH